MDALTRSNVLGNAIFDIAFATQDEAFTQNMELSEFINNQLVSIIDEVFDEIGADNIYSFESLELDLGEMAYIGYKDEMAQRLRDRLRSLLLSKLPAAQSTTTADSRVISQQRSNFECFTYFLEHGRLPWHAAPMHVQSIEPLAHLVLQESHAELISFISAKKPPEIETLCKRLAGQLPESVLNKLIAHLAPAMSGFIKQLTKRFYLILAQEIPGTAAQTNRLRLYYWSTLLLKLFESGQNTSPKKLVDQLLQNVTTQLPKYHILLQTRSNQISQVTKFDNNLIEPTPEEHKGTTDTLTITNPHVEHMPLAGYTTHINSTSDEGLKKEPASTSEQYTAQVEHHIDDALKAFENGIRATYLPENTTEGMDPGAAGLADTVSHMQALLNGDSTGKTASIPDTQYSEITFVGIIQLFENLSHKGQDRQFTDLWGQLLADRPTLVQNVLKHFCTEQALLFRLVNLLTDDKLIKTIHFLESGSEEFVRQLSNHNYLFSLPSHLPDSSEINTRWLFWVFSLSHIVLECGRDFGYNRYLDSLLQQWSSHLARTKKQLLQIWKNNWSSLPQSDNLHAILAGWLKHNDTDSLPSSPGLLQQNTPLMDSYQYLGDISSYFAGTRIDRSGPASLKHIFAHISRLHPSLLHQLQWELYYGQCSLPEPEKSQLLNVLRQLLEQNADRDRVATTEPTIITNIEQPHGMPSHMAAKKINNSSAEAAIIAIEHFIKDSEQPEITQELIQALDALLRQPFSTLQKLLAILEEDNASTRQFIPRLPKGLRGRIILLRGSATQNPQKLRNLISTHYLNADLVKTHKPSHIITAIENFSQKTTEPVLFYKQVLEAIIQERPVDLPAIFAKVQRLQEPDSINKLEKSKSGLLPDSGLEKYFKSAVPADSRLIKTSDFQEFISKESTKEPREQQQTQSEYNEQCITSSIETITHDIEVYLHEPLETLENKLFELQHDATAMEQFIQHVPESQLARLLYRLRGPEHDRILECTDLIVSAWIAGGLSISGSVKFTKWHFILARWLKQGHNFDLDAYSRMFIHYLTGELCNKDKLSCLKRLNHQLQTSAKTTNRDSALAIRSLISDMIEATQIYESTSAKTRQNAVSDWPLYENGSIQANEEIYIDNAGLVLASPFLPRLFNVLGLILDGKFANPMDAERAIHILHYLMDGNTAASEHRMMLNKVLCGYPLTMPIDSTIELSNQEKEAADGLLTGIIQHWKGIGNASVEGLRESFLQREGCLQLKDDTWHLLVAPKSFDMLLDSLPWSIAVIKYRWMSNVIHVTWR